MQTGRSLLLLASMAGLSSIALAANATASQTSAQASEQGADGQQTASPPADQTTLQLQEVVVTATHFATEVNQTPLAISALTTANLLQQSIYNFNDLVASVPSVNITASISTGLANIAIRGINQSGPGAATTGFYLDNAPLQIWNNSLSSGFSQNGTPLPPIFDIQRVEVLEGPQGTLFGASSEGGTIRYITPPPSLDQFHIYARLDASYTKDATGGNYAPGVAVGGPIIPDVLGFRASVYKSHQAGWLDAEDPYSQQTIARGLNSTDVQEFRGALLWKPTEHFSVLGSVFASSQSTPYNSNAYDESALSTIVVPQDGYDVTSFPTGYPKPVCSSNPVSGVPNCAAYTGPLTHLTPGATYGPYALKPNTIVAGAQSEPSAVLTPASTGLTIPELDLTYMLPSFTTQLYSSYVKSVADSVGESDTEISRDIVDAQEGSEYIPYGVPFDKYDPTGGLQTQPETNFRGTWAEDLRFTSNVGPTQMVAGQFSWTAGLYYEHDWETSSFSNLSAIGSTNGLAEQIIGETAAQRYGVAPLPGGPFYEAFALAREWFSDSNDAAYGEVNYNFTNKLQGTVGLRQSHVTYAFWYYDYGPASGKGTATLANGAFTEASAASSPFTPKFELTYRFTSNNLIYALADEGFRAGGGNATPPAATCEPGAAEYGLTVYQLPKTYGPDKDWNYELGTKELVANGHVQLNADVYHIVWNGVQTSASLPGCGNPFITNAGHAASNGLELSAQAVALGVLQMNMEVGYDHAYYSSATVPVQGDNKALTVALAGQDFPLPTFTGDIGARLDLKTAFRITGGEDPYIRADWRAQSGYNQSEYPEATYGSQDNHVPSGSELDLHAGVAINNLDVNVYALNALNNDAGPRSGGPQDCENAACTTYLDVTPITSVTPFYPPLTVGLQLSYIR